MAIEIENENTFKQSLADGVNLFLGSGFSVLAKDKNGRLLPTGSELAAELSHLFDVPNASKLTLGQLCTILESSQRDGFRSFVKERFTVKEFDQRYDCLDRLEIKSIFTTNVDDLLHKVYASSLRHFLNDLDANGPAYNDRTAVNSAFLHGCVLDDRRPWSFSNLDLAAAFRADEDRWYSLTQAIQKYPTLFWGYSVSDSGTLEALSPRTSQGRLQKDKWIIIPRDEIEGVIHYFQALGFQIIKASTSEMLEYLGHMDVTEAATSPARPDVPTRELFPSEAIPEIVTVPSRPAIQFYLGEPPVWHDIFWGQLHRTSHVARIRDSINSGKHTVVIGLTACGKTTLMMQVAQEFPFSGHKLICSAPTLEKAQLIVKKLGNQRALVFVDNFADSAEAFQFLLLQSNIIAVGFDRDYSFDIISHLINLTRCNVLEVTELSPTDIQAILSKVPTEIRSSHSSITNMASGVSPSVFEVIESNIKGPSLRTRFRSVLQKLAKDDENLLDFLLACCYVHMCRTPISMDMLIAFFRDYVLDHNEIYRMRGRLGAMLSDYYLSDDDEQDYWVARSTIVSEAVIDQAPPPALKRVLTRFLKQVSPYRIHRFDIFRRKAYDEALVTKAFPIWEEGRDFYEEAYLRDHSPYLRQQGALYLAHRKRFQEAFAWIDEAIMRTGARIPSIRNSHAVILFRANITKPQGDPIVETTLQRSMDILSQCYNDDRRKTYHALTFADQALQYSDVYGDDLGRAYLETARRWLTEERRATPWNRRVGSLLSTVSRKVSSFEM